MLFDIVGQRPKSIYLNNFEDYPLLKILDALSLFQELVINY